MSDKELISRIQLLNEIKPRQDWVVSVKTQILGQERVDRGRVSINLENVFEGLIARMFQPKLAFVPVMVLILLIGISLAKNSLPGDTLYSMKKAAEKGEAVFFVSEQELPRYKLEMANRRLEELGKIAEINQVKKLAPAIAEFQANIAEAADNLVKAKEVNMKEIVVETRKIEENKQKIEALGIIVGETKKLDDVMKQLVEREMKSLENQVLTEVQEGILTEAKENYEAGQYNQALEKILLLSSLSYSE